MTDTPLTAEAVAEMRALLAEHPEPWRHEREPHDYKDGTDHFDSVQYTAKDDDGNPLTVVVGDYLGESLAELLVKMKAAMPTLLAIAERSLAPSYDRPDHPLMQLDKAALIQHIEELRWTIIELGG